MAVKEFGARRAVGYEVEPKRANNARKNIQKEGLENEITVYTEHLENADLTKADVIFVMHIQKESDFKKLWSQKLKKGTRVIKHDLPILGYIPWKIDIPFYCMKFPFRKARTQNEWAKFVLLKKKGKISEVWRELYYYGHEKDYDEADIIRFKRILSRRLK